MYSLLGEWGIWKVSGYLEGVTLLFKEFLCNLFVLEFFLHVDIMYMVCTYVILRYFDYLDLNIYDVKKVCYPRLKTQISSKLSQ